MLEQSDLIMSDIDESKEELESPSYQEEVDSDDIPPSLLSYFETSKSRAAISEKVILEHFEDFTASHKADCLMKLPMELNEDMRKLNDQTTCGTENEENKIGDKYVESEADLTSEMSARKRHFEEAQKEEQRRRREAVFQEELRKIMEAEKLHQMELELKERRAQERLEQELLLQQEIISNLKKRVEHERRMIEEEQKRKKREEEEIRAKEREEEKRREEEEKTKRQEEKRRVREAEKRNISMRLEEDRRKKEEERRKEEEEGEERKREVEKDGREEEVRKEEDKRIQEMQFRVQEMRRKRDEEERNKEKGEKKLKGEEEGTKEEKERKFLVAGKKLTDGEKRKARQEIKLMDELRMMEEDGRKLRDEGERRGETELRKSKQVEMRIEHEDIGEDGEKVQAERKSTDRDLIKEGDGGRKPEGEVQGKGGEEKKIYGERRKSVENINLTREEEEKKTTELQMETRRLKEEEIKHKQEIQDRKSNEGENRKVEHERKGTSREESQDELKKPPEKDGMQNEENETRHGMGQNVEETNVDRERKMEQQERGGREISNREGERETEKDSMLINNDELREKTGENNFLKSQNNNTNNSESWTSSSPAETARLLSDKNICQASAGRPCSPSCSPPVCLPEHTEQKRLSWMKDCVSWSKLSLKNKRKQRSSARSQRGERRGAEACRLPSLSPRTLLQSSSCKSLQEITTVTLEDLPGCSLSTLAQCNQLQSLTFRRCGLKSLEGISQLQHLCYVDVQENNISFVDCENMSSLQVLRLAYNKLKSIHGLSGAHNLNVLDLSHNSITRIAGLESAMRLQKLSLDHNQLISTRGLRDVYTLLHLDCSHNHLANTEGLENNVLLHTLDLRSNGLTEPPCLNNQVLLRELRLDDNSISSLQGLSACWLPLMQNLTAAQNRITQLPFMADFVSLENLDLRFNCLSELKNVCENLQACFFLQEIYLTGNPFQQEAGWRSTLQKAVPGLRSIDNQHTDSFLSAPAAQKVSVVSDSFLMFCQAQLQQTQDLQQRHSSELRNASSPLDAVKNICHHLTMSLKLAEDQRFAHEYGDTAMTAEQLAAGSLSEKTLDMDVVTVEKCVFHQEMESTQKVLPIALSRSFEESLCDMFDVVTSSPWTESVVGESDSGSVHILTSNGESACIGPDKATASSFLGSEHKSMAAAVIQRRWRKYRQKCGNVDSSSITERGGETKGDGETPESRPLFIYRSSADQDCAATVIQAFWRGFALRRRLACALAAAAVTWPDAGEEDTFEEVDVEEFVFDEAALEKLWTVTLSEDSSPRCRPVSEQPVSPKPPVSSHGHSQNMSPAPLVWNPKQAWVTGQHVDSRRSQSPPPSSVLSGLSERSEKILEEWGFTDHRTALLMIKRAQKMKSTKQQKKHRNPSEHLSMFRNCSYQLGPVGARNRHARRNRCSLKGAVGEAEFGLLQAERMEQMRREQAQQRPLTQPDRISESEHFLPEINSSTLNGGRVQLVADPAYAKRPHATGLWANSRLAAQPDKVNAHRNSSGQAMPPGKAALCPKQVTSAPTKKERISFRDNPVQLSGGWGGGKKRLQK